MSLTVTYKLPLPIIASWHNQLSDNASAATDNNHRTRVSSVCFSSIFLLIFALSPTCLVAYKRPLASHADELKSRLSLPHPKNHYKV